MELIAFLLRVFNAEALRRRVRRVLCSRVEVERLRGSGLGQPCRTCRSCRDFPVVF